MSFWSWLTGRNEKESDVYANYDKVADVTNEIKTIATRQVGDAQEAFYAALDELNSVNGVREYIGAITINNFDSIFDSVSTTIEGIADSLQGKADEIKAYEETPWYTKAASTLSMSLCKLGEGLLSVVEDLGDGIVSIVGWGAGLFGATDFQNDCANFIKKEWSHDAFNFYYNSEFAKASAFTEDSALAGGFKLVGKVAGYVAAGYVAAGALGIGATASVGSGLLSFSGTTIGGAVAAGLGGLGSGTEAGLNAGLSYNDAFKMGTQEALKSAAFALVAGKAGEKLGSTISSKFGKAATESADDVVETGTKLLTDGSDELLGGAKLLTAGSDDLIGATDDLVNATFNSTDDFVSATVSNTVSNTDDIVSATVSNTDDIVSATVSNTDDVANAAVNSTDDIGKVAQEVAGSADEAAEAAEKSGKGLMQRIGEKVKGATEKAKEFPGKVVQGAKDYPGKAAAALQANGMPQLTAGGVGATVGNVIADGQLQSQLNAAADAQERMERFDTIAEGYEEFVNKDDNFIPANPYENGLALSPAVEQIDNQGISSGSGGGGGTGSGGSGYLTPLETEPLTIPPTNRPTIPDLTSPPTNRPTSPDTTAPPTNRTTSPDTTAPPTNRTTSPDTTAPPTNRTTSPDTTGPSTIQGNDINRVTPVVQDSGGNGGDNRVDDSSHSGTAFDESDLLEDNSLAASLGSLLDDSAESIDEIIKGSKYSRIPTTQKPITAKKGNGSSSVIPLAAGLSVASAAGLGAKAYIDHKKNNETDEEEEYDDEFAEDDDFIADEWSEGMETEPIEGKESQEFINQDKQGEDEYYHVSESPLTMNETEELEEF